MHRDEPLTDLLGYDGTPGDRTFAAFEHRLHPDDRARVVEVLERTAATGGGYETEFRVVLPDGAVRWMASRGRALDDGHGRTLRVIGATWDITGRRVAQDRVAGLLETMAVGFLSVDGDWVVTHVNAEAERIAGVPRARLLGGPLWERVPALGAGGVEEACRRAATAGEPFSAEVLDPGPPERWLDVRATPDEDGTALYLLDVTERRAVRASAERAAERERLLSRITEELGGTLDAERAAVRLARLAVPAVADWCLVTLVDDDRAAGTRRGLRFAASWHAEPALRPVAEAYGASRLAALTDDAIVLRALDTGTAQLVPADATERTVAMLAEGPSRDALTALAPGAVAVLPLPGRTGPVGLLTLAHDAGRGPFTPEELVTARHVAARAGLVLDNARLYRQQRDLAEGLQLSLLTAPPEPDHVQIVVRYVPAAQAAQVGGDWYDAFLQRDGATVLVIGDVVGHDTRAAAAMGQIRTIVRTLAAEDAAPPEEVLRRTERVVETLQVGTAATAVVARLEQSEADLAAGRTRLRWSNAGHPPPVVLHPGGRVTALEAPAVDRLLGVTPDAPRRGHEVDLERDAVVLLYTDGLVERRDQDLDEGLARLQRTLGELAGRGLDDVCDELLARMLPESPEDDVALVAVRLHPQDAPRPPEAGPNRVPPSVPEDPADG
jgi:serine phosphatase RsbU (regulator of sigma subunit)/PAS domain-containing protein